MATAARPSLEVLNNVPPEKLDQPCKDEHLCELALSITNWQSIAPFLGLTEVEESDIKKNYDDAMIQKIKMLRKWREKFGRQATYRKLARVFTKLNHADLVEELCDLIWQPHSSSSDIQSQDSHKLHSTSEVQSSTLSYPEQAKSIRCQYANTLRNKYQSEPPTVLTAQWPPPPTYKVFNLAMISQRVLRYGPDHELVSLLQKGNVDEVVSPRNEVKLEELSDSLVQSKDRKIILIEGAPGAGKSTLAWHLCRKWEANKLFQDFEIVLFVQLREPAVQSAKSLEDLFPADTLSEKQKVVSAVQCHAGKQVLIILDSWDEFRPGLHKESVVKNLICNPSVLKMEFSALIITSRPIATAELQRLISTRIEIVGFLRSEIKHYFTETIGDSEKVQKLSDRLREHPVIEASCYLPLNTAIITHVFLALNYTLPTTLHGVFTSLVKCCIKRHLKREAKEGKVIPKISSLDYLPPDIQEHFKNLCTLAFHGVMENKATFSEEDLQSLNLPTELNTLSLMQGVTSFAVTEESKLYNFLHLSTQELLAAFYISRMPPKQQLEIFNELFQQPRFSNVFKFYSAFTKLQTEGIRDTVSNVVKSRNTTLLLSLLHCLYEAQEDTLCQFVASQAEKELDLSDKSLSPVDCITVGYFVRTVCFTENLKLAFMIDGIDEYGASLLLKELSKFHDTKPHTPVETGRLDLTLKSREIRNSPARKQICNSITCKLDLNLSGRQIEAAELADALAEVKQNLTALNLRNNQIGTAGAESLGTALKECTKLESLNLTSNKIGLEGAIVVMEKVVHVQELYLSGNEMGDEGVQMAMEKMVQFQELDGDEREAGRAKSAMKKLELIQCGIGDGGMKLLSTCMEKMVNVKELNLYRNQIGDDGARCLAEAMYNMTNLQVLDLGGNELNDGGVDAISTSLTKLVHLRKLYLGDNQISDSGCVKLCDALWHCKELQELYLGENQISDSGCITLCDAVRHCTELQVLGLHYNRISDSTIRTLCVVINSMKCLNYLSLNDNQFTWEGKAKLRKAREERDPDFVKLNLSVY